MIELGLERISRLLYNVPISWRAIHVAGTNGKGSVCAYASAMLTSSNIRSGRFTSPHLVDRWDCITINEQVIDPQAFRKAEHIVQNRNAAAHIGASEFEMLTATAFEIFEREKVQVAVVEVGLGGRHDATNVIQDPLATVITKIGLDHESLLGNSLEAIARHKAGIMKPGSPCIADGTNAPGVLSVLKENAQAAQVSSLTLVPQDVPLDANVSIWRPPQNACLEEHQRTNLAIAYTATKLALERLGEDINPDCLVNLPQLKWPGRLQLADFSSFADMDRPVLVDGAHNMSAAEVLASYIERHCRTAVASITWILAFSKGKDMESMLRCLLKPGDNLVVTEFGAVEGMPWVQAASTHEILEVVEKLSVPIKVSSSACNVTDAIPLAASAARGGQVVIAGSLYLVSEALRMLKTHGKARAQ